MLDRDTVAVRADPGERVMESRWDVPSGESVGDAGRPGDAGIADGGGGDEPSRRDVRLGEVARIVEVTGPGLRVLVLPEEEEEPPAAA